MPLNLGVGPDAKDPTIYSAGTNQGGLGLGDRDYYLKDDARFVAGAHRLPDLPARRSWRSTATRTP